MAATNMIRRVAAAVALSACAAAFADCRDDWICVNAVDQGGNVELRAENLQDYPVTYTLRVRTRYFEVSGPTTVTRTLAPQESARVMMLSRADERFEGRYRYFFEWTVGDKDAVHDDDHLYALPYASGKSYRVLQGYGSRFSHTGLEAYAVDFDMPEGTPVHAARGGVVRRRRPPASRRRVQRGPTTRRGTTKPTRAGRRGGNGRCGAAAAVALHTDPAHGCDAVRDRVAAAGQPDGLSPDFLVLGFQRLIHRIDGFAGFLATFPLAIGQTLELRAGRRLRAPKNHPRPLDLDLVGG